MSNRTLQLPCSTLMCENGHSQIHTIALDWQQQRNSERLRPNSGTDRSASNHKNNKTLKNFSNYSANFRCDYSL